VTDLERVKVAMSAVLTDEGVERWLDTSYQRFSGKTPMEMIEAGRTKELLEYIDTLADGSFS
jgi:hypothetical protein